MFLKNYTSAVPVSQTIYRIEQLLIRCGALNIAKSYHALGGVEAIVFRIPDPTAGEMTVRLPACESNAQLALWNDYKANTKRPRRGLEDFKDQGARTAWKIVHDWVAVQLSMIQMKQADPLQVFLPYVYDGKHTYYSYLKETKFKGLLPETTS